MTRHTTMPSSVAKVSRQYRAVRAGWLRGRSSGSPANGVPCAIIVAVASGVSASATHQSLVCVVGGAYAGSVAPATVVVSAL